jgi:hypothetical protein
MYGVTPLRRPCATATARHLARFATLVALLASAACAPPATAPAKPEALRVSEDRRCLVTRDGGRRVFLLADTAWNLCALTDAEVDLYLHNRAGHGFNAVMFCLDFSPQAAAENAYGQRAYVGPDRTSLDPGYFAHVDRAVDVAEAQGLYVMLYAMWGGQKAGTMNGYSLGQLRAIGLALGARYAGRPNVILVAGGESTPPYVDVARVAAIGQGLRDGSRGENLIAVHPCSDRSSSRYFSEAPWLDMYMAQVKSGHGGEKVDMTIQVSADYAMGTTRPSAAKPTMLVEHRYEVGTAEPPIIQRRSLYLSVFAGGFGYAYGHNALWQMTPHTGLPWMLKGWTPGVAKWSDALDTVAVDQLHHIFELEALHCTLGAIPDPSLVLAGQDAEISSRVQSIRDGTAGRRDATYVMAYTAANKPLSLDAWTLDSATVSISIFDPATGHLTRLVSPVQAPTVGRTVPVKVTPPPDTADSVIILEPTGPHVAPHTSDTQPPK